MPRSRLMPGLIGALMALLAGFPAAGMAFHGTEDPSMMVREIILDEDLWQWSGRMADALRLEVGAPARSDEAARFSNLLKATGYFKRVEMVTLYGADGITVRYDLEPFQLVARVSIRGNLIILKKRIRPVIRTTPYEVFSLEEAEKDVQRILSLYQRDGFFGTEVEVQSRTDSGGWGVEVIYDIREGDPGVIQGVSLEGNSFFTGEEAARQYRLIQYSFYEPGKLEEAVERLTDAYRRAGFIEARVQSETRFSYGINLPSLTLTRPLKSLTALFPGEYVGVDIILKVDEGERFDIDILGNGKVGTETIRGMLTFYRNGFMDQYEAEESRDNILRRYRNKGYYHAAVDYKLDRERRSVIFRIEEGVTTKLARIDFWGNESFPRKEPLDLMDSRPDWRGPKLYRGDILEADLKKIRAFYLTKGYVRAEAGAIKSVFGAEGETVEITISIMEGPQARISDIGFSGAEVIQEEELLKAVGRGVGSVYDPDWVDRAKKNILDLYSRQGYADCEIYALLTFNDPEESVSAHFLIREGRQKMMGRVLIAGNHRTRGYVLTREFAIREGDYFDPITVFTGRRKLFDLGFFSRVDIISPDSVDDRYGDLVIKVKERKTGKVSLGLGYDSKERWRGYIEYRERNLWGTSRGLRLKYKLSTIGQRYDAVYKEPWFLGFDQDINLNLYDEFTEETGYDIRRLGGRVFTDLLLNRFTSLYLGYRYELVDLSNVDDSLHEDEDLAEEYRIGSLQAILGYEGRDNTINPRRGYFLSGMAELAAPPLGSEVRYNKFFTQAVWVQPVTLRFQIVVSGRLGFAETLIYGQELPLSERFFAGGASTVRGYEEDTLGPKDSSGNPVGGELMFVANVELRLDLYRNLEGVAFLDAGNVWRKPVDFDFGEIRETAGLGIRYQTPVGPARLDVGYKLDRLPGEDSYRVHFTLGYPF